MSDFVQVLLVVGVGWIAVQLTSWRYEERQWRIAERFRAEIEDEIRLHCPNLYYFAYKSELRAWHEILRRKHDYFESRKDTLLDPHSPEHSDWGSVYWALLEKSSPQEVKNLHECMAVTKAFSETSAVRTRLTNVERNFLAFWRWRDALFTRSGEWKMPDDITAGLMKMTFDSTIDQFAPDLQPVQPTPGVEAKR